MRREASRYFRNKKKEYLKDKSNELATNIRDLYREVNEFQMGFQPRSNLVRDENSYLLTDSCNILSRWKNCFSQLFDVHNISDARQIEVHTADR
jgi:hypothetical protein